MRATTYLRVHVLGPAELLTAAHEPVAVRQPLARALAVRLGLARGEAVADDILIRDLWGDDDAARPAARLRVLASRLRGALGDHAAALVRSPAGFSLDAVPADLAAAEYALSQVEAIRRSGDPARVFSTTARALALWRDDPLADLGGIPFVGAERLRLESLRLELQLAWAESGLAHGRPIGPELEQLVRVHPLHERLVGLSARALAGAGRQADALERLHALRIRLADELGIDPAPETVALEAELRGPRTPVPTPLPTATKLFVGREEELEVLLRGIEAPGLITLLGGPGAGKTRLARELAARTTDSGRPVAWLDLAPLQPGDDLMSAVGAAVGAISAEPSVGHAAELLTGALLVVDNAEHLVDEIAPLVDALRSAAIELSIVVTSQRSLRLPGEQVHRLRMLTVQAAVQLFCDRSGALPSPAVLRICAAVDRLPLGVELAAGLTRTLSVEQLAARIDDRLRLLVRGLREAGIRYPSLRSALDWSHELLEPQVRTALRRLAVFAGGCSPEAAEFVLTGDGIERADVAGLLAELVDRCLITSEDGRFRLLETVREYALEQLRSAEDEADAVRTRHARWCVELARSSGPYGPQTRWFSLGVPELARQIRVEEPNLLAAIEWCLNDRNDPALVSAIVSPLSWHWTYRALMPQARGWLQASLEVLQAGTPERAQALWALASQSRTSGRYAEALEAGLECAGIYRTLGDQQGLARACQSLTLTCVALGDQYSALDFAHQGEELARSLNMYIVLGACLNCGGLALRQLGYPAEAKAMFEAAYDAWGSVDDADGLVIAGSNLGVMAARAGNTAEARRRALTALRMARSIGRLVGVLDNLALLGVVEAAEGNHRRAVQFLSVVDHQREALGSPLFIPDELDAVAHAWSRCRAALGAETDRLAELSRYLSPDTLTAEILAG